MRIKHPGSFTSFVAIALLGTSAVLAQGAPPAGGGGGFKLPPLLMQTDAFPDGGVVPPKFVGRTGVQPGFTFSLKSGMSAGSASAASPSQTKTSPCISRTG